jgi:uncharacterized protein YndB with AHSA1/START domain
MEKLSFEILINAPANKVWIAMWNEENFKKWTSAICEGSYVKSTWKQGDRIHFLNPNGNGMYSQITLLEPNEKMFFTHIGNLENFEEMPIHENSKSWSGATENYTLISNEATTKILVSIDCLEQYINFYTETFPKGLAIVKEIAENQ